MTLHVRAGFAWLALCVAMFANGAVRALVLQPRLGEDLARQVASLTGVLVVLLASWLFVRASPEATPRQLLRVGAGWLAATLAFEFALGLASGLGSRALLADYNLAAGRLWSLVVLAVFLGPWLCGQAMQQRADRGKRSAFDRVLRRVRNAAPEERDALPGKGRRRSEAESVKPPRRS